MESQGSSKTPSFSEVMPRKRKCKPKSTVDWEECLAVLCTRREVVKVPQICQMLPNNFGGVWLLTGGNLQMGVNVQCWQVKKLFKVWSVVALVYSHQELRVGRALWFESPDDLIMCIALGLCYPSCQPLRQRFTVYRGIALRFGYSLCTRLPPLLEAAVKYEYPEPDDM